MHVNIWSRQHANVRGPLLCKPPRPALRLHQVSTPAHCDVRDPPRAASDRAPRLGARSILTGVLRGGSVCLNSVQRFDRWSPAGFRRPRFAVACRNRLGPVSSGQGSNAACGRCTIPLHKTHNIAGCGDVRVCYEWHPWSGRAILRHEVIERSAGAVARCSLAEVPD